MCRGECGKEAMFADLEIVVMVDRGDDIKIVRRKTEAAKCRQEAGDGEFVEGHAPIDEEEIERGCGGFVEVLEAMKNVERLGGRSAGAETILAGAHTVVDGCVNAAVEQAGK